MNRKIELTVGFFILLAIASALFLCLRVTDSNSFIKQSSYRVYAVFDNIGGLKVRSPVKIGGVVIGRISDIKLKDYKPYVSLDIDSSYNDIPASSSIAIKTSGLLGEQYIDISIGVSQSLLDDLDSIDENTTSSNPTQNQHGNVYQEGFIVHNTTPALVIEDLIGKFLYSSKSSTDSNQQD